MHHGYGNLEKASKLLPKEDVQEFQTYINSNTTFNPHIMYISKSIVLDKWFRTLFTWLFKCETLFGFEKIEGL